MSRSDEPGDPDSGLYPGDSAEDLARLRAGDRAAFSELVHRHHRALIALVRPIVGQSDAEEVVQMAWVKAYLAIADFEGRSGVRTWLGRIAINEARMWLRKHRRELLLDDVQALVDEDPLAGRFGENGRWARPPSRWRSDSPEALLMGEQLADCLEELLEAMPPRQRAVFEMRDITALSFEEVCNELGVSASNARVLLHRARLRVFALVDHYEETGEC